MDDVGGGFFRFIGRITVATVALLLAAFVALIIKIHFNAEPPDLAGYTHSQPIAAEDQAATSAISDDLKTLAPAQTPWLVPGPRVIFDRCTSEKAETFMPSWTAATCMRVVTAYYFSDTPFGQHLQAWSATLRAAGWTSSSPDAEATFYELRPPTDSVAPVPTIALTLKFAQRPTTNTLFTAVLPSQRPALTATTTYWIQDAPVPPTVVNAKPFTQYSYVAAVTLTAWYDDPSNPPTPTTTGNPAAGQCVTGSGACN